MARPKISALNQLRMLALRCAASSTEKIAELASVVSQAFVEMDGQKADKATFISVSIPVSAWKTNTDSAPRAAGFLFYADVTVADMTAADGADTVLDYASMNAAKAAGVANTATTMAGKVRYYSINKPTAALTAKVRIIQGAEQ